MSSQGAIAPARQGRLARRLRELMNASLAITAARSIPAILQITADQARCVIGAEQALIEIRLLENQSLHAFSSGGARSHGFDLERDGATLNALAQGADRPMRLGCRALRAQSALMAVRGASTGLRGWLAAPLMTGPSRLGAIQLANKERGQFTEDDEFLLAQLAQFASIAVENVRLCSGLRRSEERFRLAQRSANIGAYDWNLATGTIHWSEELPILKDLAPDGKFATWLSHIHPDDRERTSNAIEEAVAKRSDFDVETRLITSQGVVWLVSRGRVFCENGEPAHVLGVVLDVTARKQAEDLLRRSEKLAVAGRLAATIAHEINNPLESITNLLYLLAHNSGLDDTALKYVRMAQDELHRVAHIARQTLSFHRDTLTPVPVNLSELLENVLHMYARHIQASGVQVETRLELDHPVKVFPAEIQQVASNLIVNALEALGPHGKLKVHAAPAVEWNGQRRRGLRLTVADSGPGIAPEIRRHVFEPFFTTKGEKGTGLGLWVINGIVQKHQGHIRLRSNTVPGRSYTCFSIFLPLAAQLEIVRRKREPLVRRTRLAA